MQLQPQVPGKVPEGTEGPGADTEARFRVLVQSLGEVPKGSSAEPRWGSGRFRRRYWGQVPEGYGAEGFGAEGSGANT